MSLINSKWACFLVIEVAYSPKDIFAVAVGEFELDELSLSLTFRLRFVGLDFIFDCEQIFSVSGEQRSMKLPFYFLMVFGLAARLHHRQLRSLHSVVSLL
eukprot:UN25837